MFQQTFVEAERKSAKPYSLLLSLLFQIAALSALILIPLLYTQTLPSAQLKSWLMAPAPPRTALPKPPVATQRFSRPSAAMHPALSALVAPRIVPKQIAHIDDAAVAPDLGAAAATGDDSNLSGNPLLYGSDGAGTAPAPPPVSKPQPRAAKPMRIGGVVAEANLIHRVEPVYPPLAKAARVQGSVEFSALISTTGHIENLQLVRGHPLLVNAAKQAILQWQYRPTRLNGEPVEVLTSITVNFKLSE